MMQETSPQSQVADSLQVAGDQLADVLLSGESTANLVLTVGIIAAAWLLRRLVMSVVRRQVDDEGTRYFVGKSVGYVTISLAVIAIGTVWFEAFGSIGTFLGLLTAGIAIALRDLLTDVAGWLFVLTRRPFEVGDRIQIGEHQGDVVDISAFKFSILEIGNWVGADQSTGRVIHIPNAEVFREPIANATIEFPFIWNEMPVMVTFESDWRAAKKRLGSIAQKRAGPLVAQAERALKQTTRKFLIRYTKLTPTVYTDVQDSGIVLTIRYLCPPRRRRSTAEEIWEDILDAFAGEPTIDFAYPTTRAYLNLLEGKSGARERLPKAWVSEEEPSEPRPPPPQPESKGTLSSPHSGPTLVDDS